MKTVGAPAVSAGAIESFGELSACRTPAANGKAVLIGIADYTAKRAIAPGAPSVQG
jgi:hypothetical protein